MENLIFIILTKGTSILKTELEYWNESYIDNLTCENKKKILLQIISQAEDLLKISIESLENKSVDIATYGTKIEALRQEIESNDGWISDCFNSNELVGYVVRDLQAYTQIITFLDGWLQNDLPTRTTSVIRLLFEFSKYMIDFGFSLKILPKFLLLVKSCIEQPILMIVILTFSLAILYNLGIIIYHIIKYVGSSIKK